MTTKLQRLLTLLAITITALNNFSVRAQESNLTSKHQTIAAKRQLIAEKFQTALQTAGVKAGPKAATDSAKPPCILVADRESAPMGSDISIDMWVREEMQANTYIYGALFTPNPETGDPAYRVELFPVRLERYNLAANRTAITVGLQSNVAKVPLREGGPKGEYIFAFAIVNGDTGLRIAEDQYANVAGGGQYGQFGREIFFANNAYETALGVADVQAVVPGRFSESALAVGIVEDRDGKVLSAEVDFRQAREGAALIGIRFDRDSLRNFAGRTAYVHVFIYDAKYGFTMKAGLFINT